METKILRANSPQVRDYLKDFRVYDGNKRFAARVQGEGKFRSTMLPHDAEKHVLVEFLNETEWQEARPNLLFRWLMALRLPYLAYSLLPLLLAFCAYHEGNRVEHLALGIRVFFAISFLHIGCNLWNDFEDHLRGVDAPNSSGGSGVIRKLWIPAVHMRNAAACFFVSGFAIGVSLLFLLSWQNSGQYLLWIGLAGSIGAASYSGWPFHYKYIGLGEPIIFLISGPLIALGACAIFFQNPHLFFWFALVSLPISFLAILRIHAGNMQSIPFDTMAGTRTIATLAGFPWSKQIYRFLTLAPYLTVLALFVCKVILLPSFLSFLSLPLVFYSWQKLQELKGPMDPNCRDLRATAAMQQVIFGLLYCVSFLL